MPIGWPVPNRTIWGFCHGRTVWLLDREVISEVIKFADFARGPGSTASRLDGPGDPAVQARQVFENLRRCLAAAGASFGDVVKLTFGPDAADLLAVRAARDAVIDTNRPPASTAVQVAALFAPAYLLEVEAWALTATGPTPTDCG